MRIHKEYRLAMETCPTPLMLVSLGGEIILSNKRCDDLFGYDTGELHGKAVEVLVPGDARDFHPELRTAFVKVPTSRNMGTGRDLYGVRKSGEMIPVEIGLEPVSSGDADTIMVSVVDIRERKASELRNRQALDAATSAMVMVDDQGFIQLVNEQTLRLFEYRTDELIGKSIEILVPQRFERKHRVYRASYEHTRYRRPMGTGQELFGVKKSGAEVPVEIGLNPIDAPEGQMIMATIIDITDRKKSEAEIHAKNVELQRLNTELSEFAYSASHDLKAPLSSIAGTLQFVEEDLESGNLDEVRQNLERAKRLAARLAMRIEDLLSLAKSDRLESEITAVGISELVDDVWQAIAVNEPSVRLSTDFSHTEPFYTQRARMLAILENLLSNAIKYRKPGDGDALVQVKTWETSTTFYISVTDDGIGIPQNEFAGIFGLFRRGTNAKNTGSGVGLALVKKNVDRLHGDIDISSSDDGTIFTVSFPINIVDDEAEGLNNPEEV